MKVEGNKVTADSGMVLRRKSDYEVCGDVIYLGKAFRLFGRVLPEPIDEKPEDYEDVEEETAHLEYEESNKAREEVLKKIGEYDVSDNVNSFYFGKVKTWLDKNTRVGLVNSVNMTKAAGGDVYTVWLNGYDHTMPCDTLLAMLNALELYAIRCYYITEKHKSAVMNMSGAERIRSYDYKAEYPEMLRF